MTTTSPTRAAFSAVASGVALPVRYTPPTRATNAASLHRDRVGPGKPVCRLRTTVLQVSGPLVAGRCRMPGAHPTRAEHGRGTDAAARSTARTPARPLSVRAHAGTDAATPARAARRVAGVRALDRAPRAHARAHGARGWSRLTGCERARARARSASTERAS